MQQQIEEVRRWPIETAIWQKKTHLLQITNHLKEFILKQKVIVRIITVIFVCMIHSICVSVRSKKVRMRRAEYKSYYLKFIPY